jgi:hypothetical protein
MVSKEILKERERIKKLHEKMLEEEIERRQYMKKRRSQHVIAISSMKRLQEDFFWNIDNPGYKRVNVYKLSQRKE